MTKNTHNTAIAPYSVDIHSIGYAETPYQDKFGVPRQPGLVKVSSFIRFHAPYNDPDAFRGLEAFSHIWVQFIFDKITNTQWKPTVRPPRLGGNQRLGVFATRATHRPNSLGLSKVRLLSIIDDEHGLALELEGLDLVNGTPIVDIKPYIAYVDSQADAQSGFANTAPEANLSVVFEQNALDMCVRHADLHLQTLISETLVLDPRPAYAKGNTRIYGIRLYHFDIRWSVNDHCLRVHEIIDEAKA